MKSLMNENGSLNQHRRSLKLARHLHDTETVQCHEVGKLNIEHDAASLLRFPGSQNVRERRKMLLGR